MDMLPEAYHHHPDGFAYETVHDDGKPMVVIKTGPVGERALAACGTPSPPWRDREII